MRMEFRTGTHNPFTIYVTGETDAQFEGRGLLGWSKPGEWFIGSLPNEALVAVAVEALNAFVCERCPWGCNSCSLNRSDCGCYEHAGDTDTRVPGFNAPDDPPQVGALMAAIDVTSLDNSSRYVREIAVDLIAALGEQGWRLIHD